MSGSAWTEERDAVLRAAWPTSTAAEIAAKLGGFAHARDGGRSAVCGRAFRLGLQNKPKKKCTLAPECNKQAEADRRTRRNARRREHRAEQAAALGPKSRIEAPPFEPKGLSFADLRSLSTAAANQCRGIDGRDAGPDFLYCGSETLPGESYCSHCSKIVYEKGRAPLALTQEQREKRIELGRARGFANVRSGRSNARTFTSSMVPVVDGEALV